MMKKKTIDIIKWHVITTAQNLKFIREMSEKLKNLLWNFPCKTRSFFVQIEFCIVCDVMLYCIAPLYSKAVVLNRQAAAR